MSLRVYNTKIGEVDMKKGPHHLDIHLCNALAAFMYSWKEEDGKDWWTWYCFFDRGRHIQQLLRLFKKGKIKREDLFGNTARIKLNLYYKEAETLARFLTKIGYRVTCYYKEPKQKSETL